MSIFKWPNPDKHLANRINSACIKAERRGASLVDISRQLLNAAVFRLQLSCGDRNTLAMLTLAMRRVKHYQAAAALADAELLEEESLNGPRLNLE